MKKMILFCAVFLSACGAPGALPLMAQTPLASPHAMETASPNPPTATATIGYQATAAAAMEAQSTAQAQADTANRLMVQATNDEAARIHAEQLAALQATQQAEADEMIVLGWTATAQLTAIPATQTQQAANNILIPTQQSLMATSQMMTMQAPTQIALMAQAEAQARFAPMSEVMRITFFIAMSLLMLAVAVFVFRVQPAKPAAMTEMPFITPYDEGTVVTVKNEARTQATRLMVPATPEMLDELAEGVISLGKTLRVNNWEGGQSEHWTRETFYPMRNWLLSNAMARSTGQGGLVLTAEGEGFLRGWLDAGAIPPLYEFDPNLMRKQADFPHAHEAHVHEKAVGGVCIDDQ